MTRLTADLVQKCPQYTNPLREREIDLRGHKLAEIENLGVLGDSFDSIDLSDNEIVTLGNFPLMKRLRTVILHNNRLSQISSGLCHALPGLENLVLHNNNFRGCAELQPLVDLPRLQRLSLVDNPVTRLPDYRLFVIARLPNLKHLDYARVTPEERAAATELFGKQASLTAAHAPGGAGAQQQQQQQASAAAMTDSQKEHIARLIQSATSLEDMKRIEERELPPVH
eukprot:Rhum_TRINITY_DN4731_c0_g1::Rhum_TRINITY_DN4731_c0_g1_i1::g.15534::m.15534/K11092/SNRPA1; U2 small nuclear ribonucleoprotein A'